MFNIVLNKMNTYSKAVLIVLAIIAMLILFMLNAMREPKVMKMEMF